MSLSPQKAMDILNKSVVKRPTINMQPGEVCYFQSPAAAVIAKNQVIGTQSYGSGSSLYIKKMGIGLRGSQSTRRNIRGTVYDRYDGTLFLTSKRFVLTAYKGGFDIRLDKITTLDFYSDGLMVSSGGKSYLVGLNNVGKLKRIIEANNAVQHEYANSSRELPQENTDTKDAQENNFNSIAPTVRKNNSAGLWIGFLICLFVAVFALVSSHKLKFFLVFGALALGFALHIDPLKLREKGKMLPVAATWMICAAVAVIGLLVKF